MEKLLVTIILALGMATLLSHGAPSPAGQEGSTRATKRLMKELKGFHESDSYKNGVFTVELVDGNIYEWNVKAFKFDPDSEFYESLMRMKEKGGKDHVMLHLEFPDNYPFSPPFVRLAYPYIKGGFVYNGAICMEILSENHWSSAYTIEPLILQIMSQIARSGFVTDVRATPYTYEKAKSAFHRLSEIHGWKIE